VSSDELNRVLGARIEEAQRLQHNNVFWLHYLAGAQADPRRLQLAIDEVSQIKSLTASDVKAAAQKWLVKGKSWRMMITPTPQPAKPHKVKPARARSSARAH
jgi:zinc protease